MRLADLHIHTYYSDSTSSPEEVVAEAVNAGLTAIAITDHDIIDGVNPTIAAAVGKDSDLSNRERWILQVIQGQNNTQD